MKNTVSTFQAAKEKGEKLTMLTAYDYSTAKLMDEAGINGILVGDSLGNVILGYEDTISVTMEDMIHHGAAVARGTKDTMVVVDMPFMSYQTSVYDAVMNAGRLMKEGRANAVKLEGGAAVVEQIKAAKKLIEDALAVQEAGAFAVVLECIPAKLASIITKKLTIPTIGIGAGAGCDGQILVYQDMLGMFSDYVPKFVKRFADVGSVMKEAFQAYGDEVRAGSYPAQEHTFQISDDVLDKLY